MSETSPGNRCPTCGGVMPTNAPQGLCPKCLLLGVAAPTESGSGQARPAAPALDAVAAAFPQLEILELIGQGGMGCVFKARQPQLNRFVALKILPEALAQDAAFAARFAREAQALAALGHPNIVTVHDSGQSGGFFYLLMEFVDGANLRQALRAGRFTPEQALAIVPPICDALQFAHEHGIVHRDIKPENVLLDKAGRVKIADFGIAKMVDGNTHSLARPSDTLSPTGGEGWGEGDDATQHTAPGTPQYMAPEQRTDSQRADHRADIYSLGVVFYEMLTGELPSRQLEPPSFRIRGMQIDVRLDEVVLRALEKSPELRWQTAAELRTQVETIATIGSAAASAAPVGAAPTGTVRGSVFGGVSDPLRDSRAIRNIPRRKNRAGVLLLCAPPTLFAWFVLIGYRVVGVDLDADVQFWTGLIGFPLSTGFGVILAWPAGAFHELSEVASTDEPRRWSARAITAAALLVASVLLMGGGMVMLALVTQEPDWNPSPGEAVFVLTLAGGGLLAVASTMLVGWSARKQLRREPLRLRGWGGAFAASWFWPGVAVGLIVLSLPALLRSPRSEDSSVLLADPRTQKPSFGPVIERVVKLGMAIDFDTGKLDTPEWPSREGAPGSYFPIDWMVTNGFEALRFESERVASVSTKVKSLANEAWDQVTAAHLIREMQSTPFDPLYQVPLNVRTNGPTTYGFETSQGGTGLLQVSFTNNPAGVKIRYKLVQNTAASALVPSPTVDSLPPVVVRTEPASGARDVEPGIVEIRVRFSKEMTDRSWSWTTAWTNSTPEVVDGPRYDQDLTTCVIKAKLEPGRTYAWWLNTEKFQNFKDNNGNPAVPYLFIFQTRGKEGSP